MDDYICGICRRSVTRKNLDEKEDLRCDFCEVIVCAECFENFVVDSYGDICHFCTKSWYKDRIKDENTKLESEIERLKSENEKLKKKLLP